MKTYKSKNFLKFIACGLIFASATLSANDKFLGDEDFYEEELESEASVYDPLETINRYTFKFNDFVYMKLIKPIADGYEKVTPDPVKEGASNFFDNLKYPIRLSGNLLQGRLKGAWVETGRFAINSTIGVAGIFTPADDLDGFEPIPEEDIGQALGSWGIGEGPYLVLPLLGPSNLRELGGFLADKAVNPLEEPFSLADEKNWDLSWESETVLDVTDFIVTSPSVIDRYIQLKDSSVDPYSAIKNGFTQYRRAAIEQ